MTTPLKGRVALITGSSRGVGRAIALRLAAEGAAVAVNYRREADAADNVVGEIRRAGGTAAAFGASIDDAVATAQMVTAVAASLGPVDLLVSNAGTASRGQSVKNTAAEEFERLLRVHALGPVALIQRLLPGMREAARADIVLISSVLTDQPPPLSAPYTMAKAAAEAAIRTLAHEERRHRIRANIVAPGLVATDMGERLVAATTGKSISEVEAVYPFGRSCRPEDIAGAVSYLVSADGGYVTGQRLVVDGGGAELSIVH